MRLRYEETAAGKIRQAFGITEPDRAATVERAEEIRSLVDRSHRETFDTGYEISTRSAEAIADTQLAARPLIPTTVAEWNARMRATDPLWEQDGCLTLRDGVCRIETGTDGETVYYGGSAEMRATLADAARLRREREQAAASAPRAARLR